MDEITERRYSVRYDGTNGSVIAGHFGTTPISDDGSVLVFSVGGQQQRVNVGQRIAWRDTGGDLQVIGVFDASTHDRRFRPRSTATGTSTRGGAA